jgi:hypothetical protein
MQQLLHTRHLARPQFQVIGAGTPGVRESGDKKYQLSRFIARAVCAVTEMDTRGA